MSAATALPIFIVAGDCDDAANWLWKGMRSNAGRMTDGMALMGPVCLMSAFTVELYLKCLLENDGVPKKEIHDLDKLFKRLSHGRKVQIGIRFNAHVNQRLLLASRRSQKRSIAGCGLSAQLKLLSRAFPKWRYRYDGRVKRLHIDTLPVIRLVLRDFLLELNPRWKNQEVRRFLSTFPIPKSLKLRLGVRHRYVLHEERERRKSRPPS